MKLSGEHLQRKAEAAGFRPEVLENLSTQGRLGTVILAVESYF